VCEDFEVGGIECLEAVLARRTRDAFEAIRNNDDPHYADARARIAALKARATIACPACGSVAACDH
jgi:hypothetical protein